MVSLCDHLNHFRRKYHTYSLLLLTFYLGALHFATPPFLSVYFRSFSSWVISRRMESSGQRSFSSARVSLASSFSPTAIRR